MSTYRLVRQTRCGWFTVGLGMAPDGRVAYLVRPLDEHAVRVLGACASLPACEGTAEVDGQTYRLFRAPEGVSLAALTAPLTPHEALAILEATVSGLAVLEETGICPRGGSLSQRMLIRDVSGNWHLDFLAACLAPQDGQTLGLEDAAGDLSRLCFSLLSRPELGSAPELDFLHRACSGRAPASLEEWGRLLQRVRGARVQKRGTSRRPLIIMATAVVAAAAWVSSRSLWSDSAEATEVANQAPAIAVAVAPEHTVPATASDGVSSPESPGVAPSSPPVKKSNAPSKKELLELETLFAFVPEPEPAPVEEVVAPPPPPKPTVLPGPYCEPGVRESRGANRYLVLDGAQVCTAHVLVSGGVFISHDALARLVETSSARLEPSEFVRRDGQLWIAVRAATMAKFRLGVERTDGTTVALRRQ